MTGCLMKNVGEIRTRWLCFGKKRRLNEKNRVDPSKNRMYAAFVMMRNPTRKKPYRRYSEARSLSGGVCFESRRVQICRMGAGRTF